MLTNSDMLTTIPLAQDGKKEITARSRENTGIVATTPKLIIIQLSSTSSTFPPLLL